MQKVSNNFSDVFPTWIIAYCPDTNSFFALNQRCFFWECDKEFATETDAIRYFQNHIEEFLEIRNNILKETGGWSTSSDMYFENTKENYPVKTQTLL